MMSSAEARRREEAALLVRVSLVRPDGTLVKMWDTFKLGVVEQDILRGGPDDPTGAAFTLAQNIGDRAADQVLCYFNPAWECDPSTRPRGG